MPFLRYEKRSFEGHPLRARVLHPDARVESGTWQGIGGEDQERSELEGRMIMLWYPVTVELDTNDTILVSFPDFPEAHTFGDDENEALARAADLLEDVLADHIDGRRDIPPPSKPRRRDRLVVLPVLTQAKVALYREMRA